MKKTYYLLLALCLFITFKGSAIEILSTNYLTFKNYIGPVRINPNFTKIPSKTERLSNDKSIINLVFDDNIPDSIITSFTVAKEMWESKLHATAPINICVSMEELDSYLASFTLVQYQELSSGVSMPSSLYRQIYDLNNSFEDQDAFIIINSDIEWDCSFNENECVGTSSLSMALRSMASALGFGSSVIQDPVYFGYTYNGMYPSCFDKLIYQKNSGTPLTAIDLHLFSADEYLTSNDLYVKGKHCDYKLFSRYPFRNYLSLIFLDEPMNLMNYDLFNDKIFKIDASTIDILNSIGWNIEQPQIAQIVCNDIDSTGIGSSYKPHLFSLKSNHPIDYVKWKFSIREKSGDFIEFLTDTNDSLTIPSIKANDNYYISINGDYEGKIDCEYFVGSNKYKAKSFYVALELKPIILSIKNVKKTFVDNDNFIISMNVEYRGSDHITIGTEEDYQTIIREKHFYEPFRAHLISEKISKYLYSWVYLTVNNKYGKTEQVIEFGPIRNHNINSVDNPSFESTEYVYDIYNLQGIKITSNISGTIPIHDLELSPGIYFKVTRFTDDKNTVEKIHIK